MIARGEEHGVRRVESVERPWSDDGPVRRAVFCVLWATGPDTSVDGLFRLSALRAGSEPGSWEAFERTCEPYPGCDEDGATARMVREFGVGREEIEGRPPAADVWPELRAFCGDGPLLVLERESFGAWLAHFEGDGGWDPTLLGHDELRDLLFPGRRAPQEAEVRPRDRHGSSPEAIEPADLQAAFAELIGRFLDQPSGVIDVAALGYAAAWSELRESAPRVARRLELALALAEHPSLWTRGPGGLFPAGATAPDRLLSACCGEDAPPEGYELCDDELEPRWTREWPAWKACSSVPVDSEGDLELEASDRQRLDDVFQVHLPELLGKDGGYRAGQHEVARGIADVLGSGELLLVHAPTGTGKTLAYLVPALLWSTRHGVRVCVSTYTRALQEQALEYELPRARRALARAGGDPAAAEARVTLLKGRRNYLCWRALRLQQPAAGDGGAAWLAWTRLVLFGLTDEHGDLDRLPRRAPLGSAARAAREGDDLLRAVRADTGCCRATRDLATCAAHVARQRAERSHVVIANHAYVLARQAAFRHVVFDECEHLHDQAHGAWSHQVGVDQLGRFLERLRRADRPTSRAPLDRLQRAVVEGSSAAAAHGRAVEAWSEAGRGLELLRLALRRFERWRQDARRERNPRDEHSLLREYVLEGDSEELVGARRELSRALAGLETALAELSELLDTVPSRGVPRLRRSLDLLRGDLAELQEGIEAWLPIVEGAPRFREETFHDVERDARGQAVLAARVLLPNEYLGRRYYPALHSAAFVSATTCLRGGFDAARGYLGLDRAAEPLPEEEREPMTVRTVRAPDPFDYGRVVVCVPKDAPAYARRREEFHGYVRDFLAHLGERTRGRVLALFTNAEDVRRTGEELESFFRARRIPFWYQGMRGASKEELGQRFRTRVDSVLLGLDTFWYGADFPGETLEYLVIVKLPYGVPDGYHHAQCAVLGSSDQRRRIYMPRALAKFRQGFGRLMRKESDRGAVFVLDGRVLDPRHRLFLGELPLADSLEPDGEEGRARLVRGETERCLHEALGHLGLLADVRRRGLDQPFGEPSPSPGLSAESLPEPLPEPPAERRREEPPRERPTDRVDPAPEDVPF